jgi:ribosomal protein S27AE
MTCPTCTKGSIIEIRMQIAGEELTFRRCGRCESQSWATADGRISLTHVLELARAM